MLTFRPPLPIPRKGVDLWHLLGAEVKKHEVMTKDEMIKTYGEIKPVRYLVTSAIDFKEIVSTTNMIFAKVGSLPEIEGLEKLSSFSVIPLPDTFSRFIACFEVPSSLLGENRDWTSERLDFQKYTLPQGVCRFEAGENSVKFTYEVTCLFEANLALSHFDRCIAKIVDSENRLALKRSVRLHVYPGDGNGCRQRIEIALPQLSPEQIRLLNKEIATTPEATAATTA